MADEGMTEAQYTTYGRRRRSRWPILAAVAAAALVVVAVIIFVEAPHVSAVSPASDAFVSRHSVTVTVHVAGLNSLSNLHLSLDGRDVTRQASFGGGTVSFATGPLADGAHAVALSADSSNLFRHHVTKRWTFTIDTSVPTLDLAALQRDPVVTGKPAVFRGKTEPGARVTFSMGSVKATATADGKGRYTVSADLPEGRAKATFTVADKAGNTVSHSLTLTVDTTPPHLVVTGIKPTQHAARPVVTISATDAAAPPEVTATLDGEALPSPKQATSTKLKLGPLAQGTHTLLVTATDPGLHTTVSDQTFLVDSTERFGAAQMVAGARGKDVVALQKRLHNEGVFGGKPTGVYGLTTIAAVERMQKKYGMTVDGKVGEQMLAAMSGRIVVDISQLRLYLYLKGKLFKSFPVATGQPAYPTPTGSYAITSMIKDPTWLPPNSDWAKNAKPIPPGALNPLGTRWMGTSAPGVGIHGTPEDYSIGTYASHGCIRMHIWDAETLFNYVVVGMPVIIQN